ncbi:MAG TPA: hypothetical protein PKI55_09785 [Chitinophagaceae bacterium]|nr:hypothetical protein [Chitinophagaceae bacterium]
MAKILAVMRFAMMRRYLFVMIFFWQRLLEGKWFKPAEYFSLY